MILNNYFLLLGTIIFLLNAFTTALLELTFINIVPSSDSLLKCS